MLERAKSPSSLKPLDQKLSDPQGVFTRDILSSVSSATSAEVYMQSEQQLTSKSKRDMYAKFMNEQKAEIAK